MLIPCQCSLLKLLQKDKKKMKTFFGGVGGWVGVGGNCAFISLSSGDTYLQCFASLKWVIVGSGHGLVPIQGQAIAWTNADIFIIPVHVLSFGPLGANFNDMIFHQNTKLSFNKINLKTSSAKMTAILIRPQYDKSFFFIDESPFFQVHHQWQVLHPTPGVHLQRGTRHRPCHAGNIPAR